MTGDAPLGAQTAPQVRPIHNLGLRYVAQSIVWCFVSDCARKSQLLERTAEKYDNSTKKGGSMKAWITMVGLLVALGVVGLMAKQQMKAMSPKAPPQVPAASAIGDSPSLAQPAPANPQQIKDDVQRQLDAAMQGRNMPADAK